MDVVTVPSKTGSMVVDFDAKTITLNRQGFMAKGAGLTDMTIRFEDITHVEISQPTFFQLGICWFILNGTRYVVPGGGMDATNFNVAKRDFPLLENTLKRVMSVCGITGFTTPNSINFPTVVYSGGVVSGEARNNADVGAPAPAPIPAEPAVDGGVDPAANAGATPYSPPPSPIGGFLTIVGWMIFLAGFVLFAVYVYAFFANLSINYSLLRTAGIITMVVGLVIRFLGKKKG